MMYADLDQLNKTRTLVVGAGGIGCELLKNLVLSGFKHIDLIDLDTIDVSNLNRQFLFQKKHVGRSKAEVAKESALSFNPEVNITSYHTNIQNPQFDVNYFKSFDIVLNALDNKIARSHVNRMCLAADVPLVESGTAGYLGQSVVIKKGVTECFECNPAPPQKSYPGCTIRNTPSEPVHCVVWAKHLFNQLFGEADEDEDVSPDMADPELQEAANAEAENSSSSQNGASDTNAAAPQEPPPADAPTNGAGAGPPANVAVNGAGAGSPAETGLGNIIRISTRKWAEENGFDPRTLFQKLFCDDINYLLTMETLWKKRTPPKPLLWEDLPDKAPSNDSPQRSSNRATMPDQIVWSPMKCRDKFNSSLLALRERYTELPEGHVLTWDKDDDNCMDFVASCADLRAFIFHIPMKSRFDLKSVAGNIIPAIATTNAIVAGVLTLKAMKIIAGNVDKCSNVFVNRIPNARGHVITTEMLHAPNPKCYVCSPKPEVQVMLDVAKISLKVLEEKILKQHLSMVQPDVEISGTGCILISSEEGETTDNMGKYLSDFHIGNGSRLSCDDFFQQYNVLLVIVQSTDLPPDQEFRVLTDLSTIKAAEANPGPSTSAPADDNDESGVICDGEGTPGTLSNNHEINVANGSMEVDVAANAGDSSSLKRKRGAGVALPTGGDVTAGAPVMINDVGSGGDVGPAGGGDVVDDDIEVCVIPKKKKVE